MNSNKKTRRVENKGHLKMSSSSKSNYNNLSGFYEGFREGIREVKASMIGNVELINAREWLNQLPD
jgi:hypothetical protein